MTTQQDPEDRPPRDIAPEHTSPEVWRLVSRVLIPCETRAVKSARDHVARLVRANGLASLLDESTVITAEIVTNAITHGSPAELAVLLEVEVAPDAVRVSVLDYSDQLPVLRDLPPEGAETGRGLHLINSLAKSWGSRTCHPDGFSKVVWAELA
jgi:anti-sigma regulatory factor (Ser/Thr protein kinase)